VSAKVKNPNGVISNRSLGQKLVVDTIVPDFTPIGLTDGVAWTPQTTISGALADRDSQLRIEYEIRSDGTTAVSAVMGATIDAPNSTSTITRQNLTQTTLNFGNPATQSSFKPYDVVFKVTDRAGNITTQNYKGMVLNLPTLTEASVLLPDSLIPDLPDDRPVLNPNDPNNPNNPNDPDGRRWFVGGGGSWGYGTKGSGSGWNWNNGGVGGGNPPLPPHVIDPDTRIAYLPALRLMLTTARDVLSNHPDTVVKKEALRQQLEMLMAVGEVVEANAFYDLMSDSKILKGVFAQAYAPGGITKRQAVWNGWAFAKNLAIETKITSLQMFEANLYVVSLAALKQNGMSGVSATDLKIAIDSLALNYAILRPSEASKGYGQPLSTGDFLGNLWNNGKDYISWHRSVYGGGSNYLHTPELEAGRWNIKDAIADLAQHLQGQANPLQALRMVDRMLQAATQVSQLHQDGFVGTTPGWYTARRTY
jgi:hypothetical protein